jgi:L-aspartate oxidase
VSKLKNRAHYPVLVIGTGIAGLTVAFSLARAGVEVLLVTKTSDPADCNTSHAQGGIIYQGMNDSPEQLVEDIIQAGAGLCDERSVHFLANEGPKVVERILIDEIDVPFKRTLEGELDLAQEGAHSISRIIHSGDATGRAIEIGLLNRVRAEKNVTLVTDVTAIDLLTTHHHPQDIQIQYRLENECLGAYLLDNLTSDVYTIFADYTVLATGGIGRVYLHTTNTRSTIGDGVVMAHRAGARIMNAEYVQFHPTALASKGGTHFLISEALRGDGARLMNQRGEYFMERYAPRMKDLAPRDVVTRAIVEEMTCAKEDFVYLDLASFYKGREPIPERFPTISERTRAIGIDMEREPIPVVPAAHYFCGGILVDNFGHSTLHRLFAIGETSCTGVHGANRLASTSLLEGLAWGYSAAAAIRQRRDEGGVGDAGLGREVPRDEDPERRLSSMVRRALSSREAGVGPLDPRLFESVPDWIQPGGESREDPALILQDWTTIQHTMWNYVGIVRTLERLERAVADMRELGARLNRFYHESQLSREILELFHGQNMASIIASAAIRNPVSRGAHFRRD